MQLKENIITLSVTFNRTSNCAVDTPTINAYVLFGGNEYKQEMTQTTLTNPFRGASYEALFDPSSFPSLSGDNIECHFEVISYSPSGYEIDRQNLTTMLSDKLDDCFGVEGYSLMTYNDGKIQIQLDQKMDTKFSKPCDPGFGQDGWEANYSVDGVPFHINSDEF